jgi:hypothetical protein
MAMKITPMIEKIPPALKKKNPMINVIPPKMRLKGIMKKSILLKMLHGYGWPIHSILSSSRSSLSKIPCKRYSIQSSSFLLVIQIFGKAHFKIIHHFIILSSDTSVER